jgi:hypothetical protein
MKRTYEYDHFINKLHRIYQYQNLNPIRESNHSELNTIVPGNKRTKEEINILQENRKKEQRIKIKEKYTNEEHRKIWIHKIVKNRMEKSK